MPNAVTRPPRGTMTRFARMPVTEARLKWKARMGSTPRDAAAEATRDVRRHRHGLAGRVKGGPPPASDARQEVQAGHEGCPNDRWASPRHEGIEDDANDGDQAPRQWWKLQETGEEEEDPGGEPAPQ